MFCLSDFLKNGNYKNKLNFIDFLENFEKKREKIRKKSEKE